MARSRRSREKVTREAAPELAPPPSEVEPSGPKPEAHVPPEDEALVLGVFRFVFALVVLFAIADLAPDVVAFYSDEGVAPRVEYFGRIARLQRFSLMDAFGQPFQVVVYYACTCLALVCLALGYRTRLAAIASFLLVTGMHERNVLVADGADGVSRVLLFWLAWSDAGAAFSLDARRRGAAIALRSTIPLRLLRYQIAFVYGAAVVAKVYGMRWIDGTAAHYALSTPNVFTRPFATAFADNRPFVLFLTYGTILAEAVMALGFVAPGRARTPRLVAIALGVAFHVGTFVFLNVGAFPFVMIASYSAFLEPRDVRGFVERIDEKVLVPLANALGPTSSTDAPPPKPWPRSLAIVAVVLFAMSGWDAFDRHTAPGEIAVPAPARWVANQLGIWQRWDMFAPTPVRSDYWVEAPGTLADGTEVDAFRDAPDGPIAEHRQRLRYNRWTKLLNGIAFGDERKILPFARWVCRQWNGRDDETPSSLHAYRLVRHQRMTTPLGSPKAEWSSTTIWTHSCFD